MLCAACVCSALPVMLHMRFGPPSSSSGRNWMRAPDSCWIFFIMSPPFPITTPIMDRGTAICSTHKHSFSRNNHNVTNITPSKHRNVRVSEADVTRHHQPSKASSLVCEQLLTMCSICHINTWRYYYYYLLQGQCFARMHTLAFVSLGSGLSVTSDTAANQILLKSKTEEFTTKAHFQPSFHQLTMSIL